MDKNKNLMEASWWERLTVGKTGSCSEGQGHTSKSLMLFFLDGRGCVPVCWGQTMVGVMKITATFKRTFHALYSVPLTLQRATVDSHLCWRLLDTHRHVWLSLLCGHCSFLLDPGAHKVLSVHSKSLCPQSCGHSVIKSHWPPKSYSLGVISPFARSPRWKICCWS